MLEIPATGRFLTERGIPYRLFRHEVMVKSLEDAAHQRNQKPEQIVRSILFRLGNQKFAMVLIAGYSQISWPKLRTYFGQSRLSLATKDEVLEITGYKVGSVSPFALLNQVPIFADTNIMEYEEISLGSGQFGTAIIMKSSDLLKALDILVLSEFANHSQLTDLTHTQGN